jgi:chromosome segregation ATPase
VLTHAATIIISRYNEASERARAEERIKALNAQLVSDLAQRQNLVEQLQDERQRLEKSQIQLQEKITDLEQFHDVVVGRELKMVELGKEVGRLRAEVAVLKPQATTQPSQP